MRPKKPRRQNRKAKKAKLCLARERKCLQTKRTTFFLTTFLLYRTPHVVWNLIQVDHSDRVE